VTIAFLRARGCGNPDRGEGESERDDGERPHGVSPPGASASLPVLRWKQATCPGRRPAKSRTQRHFGHGRATRCPAGSAVGVLRPRRPQAWLDGGVAATWASHEPGRRG
jgi:hypothetical protein